MYKQAAMVCVLIACSGGTPRADGDLDSLIEHILANDNKASTELPVTNNAEEQSSPNPERYKRDEATTETANKACIAEGVKGTCVPYYLCKTTGGVDTSGLIEKDKWLDEPCHSTLDVCCDQVSIASS